MGSHRAQTRHQTFRNRAAVQIRERWRMVTFIAIFSVAITFLQGSTGATANPEPPTTGAGTQFTLNCTINTAGVVTGCTNPATTPAPSTTQAPPPQPSPSTSRATPSPTTTPALTGPAATTSQPSTPQVTPTTPAFTRPPTSTTPPNPSLTPTVAGPIIGVGYKVVGNKLTDPTGAPLRVIGVEQLYWNSGPNGWNKPAFVTEMGKTGANMVRINPYYARNTPDGAPRSTLAEVEDMIRRGINAHMLVEVAFDGGKDHTVYLRPEVKALLFKYQKFIAIHAKGESEENNATAWTNNATKVVKDLRGAGYTAPLFVLANGEGRMLSTVLSGCAAIQAADPLHSTMFGWQAYWGSSGFWQQQNGMTLQQGFQQAGASSCAIQAGLMQHTDGAETMDYQKAMDWAKQNGIGWLWWDWRMGSDSLSTNGNYGSWTYLGTQVAPRIANESVRTAWQNTTQV